jgi:hypothetical protein
MYASIRAQIIYRPSSFSIFVPMGTGFYPLSPFDDKDVREETRKSCKSRPFSKFAKKRMSFLTLRGVHPLQLPARSPNLNSYAERWVRSVKEECLSRLILFGESSLRRALQQYIVHYHEERNHQGKDNRIIVAFRLPGYDDLSFYFVNVADFKGILAGWHFQ